METRDIALIIILSIFVLLFLVYGIGKLVEFVSTWGFSVTDAALVIVALILTAMTGFLIGRPTKTKAKSRKERAVEIVATILAIAWVVGLFIAPRDSRIGMLLSAAIVFVTAGTYVGWMRRVLRQLQLPDAHEKDIL